MSDKNETLPSDSGVTELKEKIASLLWSKRQRINDVWCIDQDYFCDIAEEIAQMIAQPTQTTPSGPTEGEVQKLAKENAIKHEAGLRALNNGKGAYNSDAEYTANYFGRMGGYIAGWTEARRLTLTAEAEIKSSPESLKRFDDGLIRCLQRAQAASDKIKDKRISDLESELSDTRQCYYEVVDQRNKMASHIANIETSLSLAKQDRDSWKSSFTISSKARDEYILKLETRIKELEAK